MNKSEQTLKSIFVKAVENYKKKDFLEQREILNKADLSQLFLQL